LICGEFHVVRVLAQESAALMSPQPCVQALRGEQRIVIAFLDDAPLIEHDQTIHGGDGG